VLVTADTNLRYQQNLTKFDLAVVVLRASTNRLVDLLPLMPEVLRLLPTLQPGDVVEVTTPPPTRSQARGE
jgi:hypothetical protein